MHGFYRDLAEFLQKSHFYDIVYCVLISVSSWLLLRHNNALDFCKLTFYPAVLFNLLISYRCFCVDSIEFPTWTITSLANKDRIYLKMLLMSFSWSTELPRASCIPGSDLKIVVLFCFGCFSFPLLPSSLLKIFVKIVILDAFKGHAWGQVNRRPSTQTP